MAEADYAEQLVTLAARFGQRDVQPVLSMARRSDLTVRVRAVLDGTQLRGRAGLAMVAATLVVAAGVSLLLAPMRVEAVPAGGDQPDAASAPAPAPDRSPASESAAPSSQVRRRVAEAIAAARGQRVRAIDKAMVEAANEDDAEGVVDLLDAGADVNAAVRGDGTALLIAARESNGRRPVQKDRPYNHTALARQPLADGSRLSPRVTEGKKMRRLVDDITGDLRFATRQLRATPAFTLVAALTLALGIGANSAIFALVDATLVRPLPFAEPQRLVALWETTAQSARESVSPLNMLDWQEQSRSFEIVAGFVPSPGSMVMSRGGTAETISRQWVTAGLFDALGVAPLIGRTIHASDNSQPARLVVFSEGLWRSYFGADPGIVGDDVRFDGELYTVLGVMPASFQLLQPTSMWAMRRIPRVPQLRSIYGLRAVGRLKPGVTLEVAQADVDAVATTLAREFPATNTGRGVRIEPLHDSFVGRDLRLTSVLFLGVVGFVLLICCANIANLLLARATARTRELAIRSAIGAGRWRVVRQLVTESLVLAALGGGLAIGVAAALLRIAPSVVPDNVLPAAVTLSFDLRVVAFCLMTAVVVGLLFGLAPAWQATGQSSAGAMASGGRGSSGHGGRARALLVVAEVAVAVLLLFGAGLLLRTLMTLDAVDRGYRAEGVVTMMVDPLGSEYPTPADLLRFYQSVEREILSGPEARSVAWTSTLPMSGSQFGSVSIDIVGREPLAPSRRPLAGYQIVSAGYFTTLDLPLVEGRAFTERDAPGAPATCIVSEVFAKRYFGSQSPIGARLALRPVDTPEAAPVVREIVGVARHVRTQPDETEDTAQVYVPLAQFPLDDVYVLVAPAPGRHEGLIAAVKAAIARVDTAKLVGVLEASTLEGVAGEATARYRFRAVLVMTFAALALLLAMVGVFGVLGYSVQQRWREFGIRRALGATTGDVLMLVAGGATRLVVAGAVIGLVAAAASTRALSTFLFGVDPLDPVTFGIVPLVLAVTAALAAAAPALRAARVDPAIAFRTDA